ncbi:hypothetical protein J169_04109 [Xanthomonas citri pv. citri]|nr:hypothetical protein J151_04112 [Xanthomonas citri subsp. citri A306]AJY92891.1 hypothetical protein J169_04109 [Xanthomonas citri pv. citri]CAE6832842.1 hypothetical protein XA1311A_36610 [Xanthomonas arboricola]AJZ10631.1 hypothetical protein J172_04102 [Xanthomonas citri pv. citri]AJZ32799.1 hypothetical protein J171_04104 [Xanthomonas citri pv. citri]
MSNTIPDLTFPSLPYGTNQVPLDLRHHLYRGISEQHSDKARVAIEMDTCGKPDLNRLPLLTALHDAIRSRIALGQPIVSTRNTCKCLRYFFAWCDANDRDATKESAAQDFYAWAEYLLTRTRANPPPKMGTSNKPHALRRGSHRKEVIRASTADDIARSVSSVISEALGMTRPLIRYTRLPEAARAQRKPYSDSDKLSSDSASSFGSTLLRICDELTLSKALGSLPVRIELRDGTVLLEWCKLRPPEDVLALSGHRAVGDRNAVLKTRKAWENDRSIRTRYPVVNLRIECELLVFLSQTGMNLAQAHRLKRRKFAYQTQGDQIIVTTSYKGRRGGTVKFQIFREYRKIIKRYLLWIENFVPADEDDRLFPFYYPSAVPAPDCPPNFSSTRIKFERLGIEWVGPRKLRNHRVNWIKGYTGSDAVAAESAQHTNQTLQTIYAKPNHATAAQEIARYHRSSQVWQEPPAPGRCISNGATPATAPDSPEAVSAPDCVSPSGCLFCIYHRDVSSQDYVWSLVSYRRLKVLEMASYTLPANGTALVPADVIVSRVTAKLDAISGSSAIRSTWVTEALSRLKEGNYHPSWSASIKLMEI